MRFTSTCSHTLTRSLVNYDRNSSPSPRDQLESILDALPDEFNALDSTIQYFHIMCSIIEVESMLLDHEAKPERTRKNVLTEPLSVNVAPLVPTLTQATN
ncbi:hypothetical protein KIW84_023551 [Lathyrus oleraceus]|uniref:Uncharacterized protein n=1 Tax=Pisum sativum TaxID=3888 RepID=A0A9D5BBC5_PEA|nr:hypothetical protein KIW84_023551 [Pisum sativum]